MVTSGIRPFCTCRDLGAGKEHLTTRKARRLRSCCSERRIGTARNITGVCLGLKAYGHLVTLQKIIRNTGEGIGESEFLRENNTCKSHSPINVLLAA